MDKNFKEIFNAHKEKGINAKNIKNERVSFIGTDFIPMAEFCYNLITGQGASGKSFLALQMVIRQAIKGKKILVWSTEDSGGVTRHRIELICRKILKIGQKQLDYILSRIDILDVDCNYRFVKKIKGSAVLDEVDLLAFQEILLDYDVAVLDPLKSFHGVDESSNSEMDLLVRDLFQGSANKSKCTLLVIHHTAKGASEDRISSRGASTISDSARLGLEVIAYMSKQDVNGKEMYLKTPDKKHLLQVYPRKDNHNASKFFSTFDFEAFPKSDIEIIEPVVTEFKQDEELEVFVSFSKNITKDFKAKKIKFNKIKDLVKSDFNYSTQMFLNNYRKNDNYVAGSNLVAFDVDDGLSLDEAFELFQDYTYVIATTKSHQKDKNGKICDRFRIIIPALNPIDLTAEEFSQMMGEVFNEYTFLDKACKDVARFFYPNKESEVYENEGGFFDWKPYFEKAKTRKALIENQRTLKAQPLEYGNGEKIDYIRKITKTEKILELLKFDSKFVAGHRNQVLYSYARYFIDLGFRDDEVRDNILWINAQSDSIPEKEIESTIFKSLRV